jgi:catalase
MMTQVAQHIGAEPPKGEESKYSKVSPTLSQENTIKKSDTLKIGVIISEGFNADEFNTMMKALKDAKTMPEILSNTLAPVKGSDGKEQFPKRTLLSTDAVLFDAIYVLADYKANDEFATNVKKFIQETYMHFKPLGISNFASEFLKPEMNGQPGVTVGDGKGEYASRFIADISVHRHWDRNVNIF